MMRDITITQKEWKAYVSRLSKLNKTVADKVRDYIEREGLEDIDELITYSYNLVRRYGEGAGALAASMYDTIAELEGKFLPPAEMAEVASYGDIAKTVNGVLKTSSNPEEISGAVSRWVKQAGADTTLKNAIRDRAEFAWIPSGDTCAFCLTLASNGWQPASKNTVSGNHADHIHSNCDCEFAIRFSPGTEVAGYNPDRYLSMYRHADGSTPQAKINAMRRGFYAENKDRINEQKRDAYAKRQELNSSSAEEFDTNE